MAPESAPQSTSPRRRPPRPRGAARIIETFAAYQKTQLAAAALLVAVLTSAVFVNGMGAPFHALDREAVVENEAYHRIASLGEVMADPDTAAVTALVNGVTWRLFPDSALAFNIVGLALHVLNGVLLVFLSRRLFTQLPPIFHCAAGLLFAVHPLVTQSLYVIEARGALLGLLFAQVAVLSFLRATTGPELRLPALIGAVVAFFLAWGSHEAVLILPLILLAFDFTLRGTPGRRRLAAHAPFWAAAMAFVVTRAASGQGVLNGPFFSAFAGEPGRVLVAMTELVHLTAVPVGQSIVHDWPAPVGVFGPGAFGGLVSVGGLLVIGAGLTVWRQLPGLALIWFVLFLIGGFLLDSTADPTSEERAYIALAGLTLLAPWIIQYALKEPKLKVALPAVVGVAIVAAGAGTVLRNMVWQDEFALWATAEERAPNRPEPYEYLGELRMQEARYTANQIQQALQRGETHVVESLQNQTMNHYQAAAERFAEALERNPGEAALHRRLGVAFLRQDNGEEARRQLLAALRHDLNEYEAALQLAMQHEAQAAAGGDPDGLRQARRYYAMADRIGELEWEALMRYGLVLGELGRPEEAAEIIQRGMAAGAPEAYTGYLNQMAQDAQGLRQVRRQLVETFREEDTPGPQALRRLANYHIVRHDNHDAFYLLNQVLRREPEDSEAWALLGVAMGRMNQTEEFMAEWDPPDVPGEASPWHYLARQAITLEGWDVALAYLETPQARAAGVDDPLLATARIAMEMGYYERANQFIVMAIETNPESPEPWLALTDLSILLEQPGNAAEFLNYAQTYGATPGAVESRRERIRALGQEPDVAVPEEEDDVIELR